LGGAGDPLSAPEESAVNEAKAAVLEEAAGDLHTVELDGPGQLSIQAHTSAPVQLTITNNHSEPRDYALSVMSSGVDLSGLPATLSLASGETRLLTPTLAAGNTNASAYFEVDAISGEDLTDADSAIAEVFVVSQSVPDQPGQGNGLPIAGNPGGASPQGAASGPVTKHRRAHCRKHKKRRHRPKCAKAKKHKPRHRGKTAN
jgi:hypothetical protein